MSNDNLTSEYVRLHGNGLDCSGMRQKLESPLTPTMVGYHPLQVSTAAFSYPHGSPCNFTTFDMAYRPQCYCKLGRPGLMLIRILWQKVEKDQRWGLLSGFLNSHCSNGLYWYTCIYNVLQSTDALKPGANAWKGLVSNIIYLCNGHIMHDKKNTRVHRIMQRVVS